MTIPLTDLDIDPSVPGFFLRPDYYDVLTRLRAEPTLFETTAGVRLVSRYDDIRQISRDPARFRSGAGVLVNDPIREGITLEGSILHTDPPRHGEYRRLLNREFTPRAVAAMEPRIRARTRDLLDAIPPDEDFDLVDMLAAPLPVTVIADVLGVPESDRSEFRRWSDAVIVASDGRADMGSEDAAAVGELAEFLGAPRTVDIAPATMAQRIAKSAAEIALIRAGARIADFGGTAIREAIREGASEIGIAQAGRDAMETEIARAFPDSELRDTWVWFQSGPNTDGAHNPLTTRRLEAGDILSLNTFPMISGYYTALERTLFLGEPDAASLRVWEANVGAHALGLGLIRPGMRCSEICEAINAFFAERDLLQYRSFGYGHSFGVLSHYSGLEAGLWLRG